MRTSTDGGKSTPRTRSVTHGLVVASVMVGGLAGVLDRALVATPAWRQLGARAWADYSRHADLGNGLVLYPIAYIGWTALALGAAISYRLDRGTPRAAAIPVYLAALCMVAVMATTAKAAPIMFTVSTLGDHEAGLQRAFDQFTFWGIYIRGTFLTLAFLSSIWALVVLLGQREPPAGAPH